MLNCAITTPRLSRAELESFKSILGQDYATVVGLTPGLTQPTRVSKPEAETYYQSLATTNCPAQWFTVDKILCWGQHYSTKSYSGPQSNVFFPVQCCTVYCKFCNTRTWLLFLSFHFSTTHTNRTKVFNLPGCTNYIDVVYKPVNECHSY